MTSYYLNREALRLVKKDDRGRVTKRKRYRRGDKVDASLLPEDRLELFLDNGTLVESEDDLDEAVRATAVPPSSPPFGAESTPHGEDDEDGPDHNDDPDAPTGEEDDTEPDDGGVVNVDAYEAMDYAELQQAAKSRDLNAGGSAQDLRDRLRAADADNE